MISVDITVKQDVTKEIAAIQAQLKLLPVKSLQEFKQLTPIKTGNARRNTTLHGSSIEGNYPYAERLENGYSKQAPKGMIKPFTVWYKAQLKKIFGK